MNARNTAVAAPRQSISAVAQAGRAAGVDKLLAMARQQQVPEQYRPPVDLSFPTLPRFDGYECKVTTGKNEFVHVGDGNGVALVIVAINPTMWRTKFDKAYDAANPGTVICWSGDGQKPDPTALQKQAPSCNNCPFAGGVEGACGIKRRAVVFIEDPNYTGLALWDINYTTLAKPVGLTAIRQHAAEGWMNGNELIKRLAGHGLAPAQVIVQVRKDDRVPSNQKNKVVFQITGVTPPDLLEAITPEDIAMYSDVTQRPNPQGAIDGDVAAPAPAPAQKAPAQRPAVQAAKAPAQAARGTGAALSRAAAHVQTQVQDNVQDAEIVDDVAPQGYADDGTQAELDAALAADEGLEYTEEPAPAPAPRAPAPRPAAQAQRPAPAQAQRPAPAQAQRPAAQAPAGLRPGSRFSQALNRDDDIG